jgi:hypothetical protein
MLLEPAKTLKECYMSDLALPSREELEMEQIRSDIALKHVQATWEPWKAMAAAFGAGATVATAMGALAVYALSHLR